MRFVLLVGVAFWSMVAFLGVRKAFETGGNALTGKLEAIHRATPGALVAAGILGVAAGVGLEIVEIVRIGRMAGFIGGFASLGFLCAVLGAVCLSAHMVLTSGDSRSRT